VATSRDNTWVENHISLSPGFLDANYLDRKM
jgi:hypothetical protein